MLKLAWVTCMKMDTVVDENLVFAHMWYSLAAENGHKTASQNTIIIVKKMTEIQIKEAQILAKKCINNNYKGC